MITLVTCWYELKAKFDREKYYNWMTEFFNECC